MGISETIRLIASLLLGGNSLQSMRTYMQVILYIKQKAEKINFNNSRKCTKSVSKKTDLVTVFVKI